VTTGIEWTDETWNPTTGCDRVSPGCDNCYALGMAKRLQAMGQADYQTDGDPKTSGSGFGIAMQPHRLDAPLRWKKPRKVFVNSMSDLFHDGVTWAHIAQVFAVMAATPQHTFQILTKRHGRMRSLVSSIRFDVDVIDHAQRLSVARGIKVVVPRPLPNVWLGVSVEDQKWANTRIPALLDTPAAVRFLSCEPLLGPVDLTRIAWSKGGGTHLDVVNGRHGEPGIWQAAAKRVDWVIVGGESGPKARPMHPHWARTLRNQCETAGVPFLFKQWGEWQNGSHDPRTQRGTDHVIVMDGRHEPWSSLHCDGRSTELGRARYIREPGTERATIISRVGKHAAGRELDGRTWDQYPAVAS